MKNFFKTAYLPWLTLFAGCVGLLLRIWLFSTGVDENGLLVSGHPAELLVWLLSVGMMVCLWFATQSLVAAPKYYFNYPPSLMGAVGCVLAALGFAFTSVTELLGHPDTLALVAAFLGIFAAGALFYVAYLRYWGSQPNILFHTLVCVYLMVRLVSQYRHWSADPQLQDYCFQLLAMVCLMLSVYYRAAFDVDMGRRRPLAFFHLAGAFFCLLSITDKSLVFFYLPAGFWAFTDLCSLVSLPPKVQEGA